MTSNGSQTAIASAVQRALHLLWDVPPHIFDDPFAYPFAGAIADAMIAGSAAALPDEVGRIARASFVVRHRWAEDELEKATLRLIVSFGAGTVACVGYAVPEEALRDDLDREFRSAAMNRAAAAGEPWLSFYTESDFEKLVRRCGFRNIAHFGPRESMRYFAGRPDGLRPSGQARYVVAEK